MPPATLFVVATPIGNLEDISLRALRVLREVNVIAAEDTRRTAKLLSHYSIAKKSISFHQHNAHMRIPVLLSRLRAGESIALVTDAGTPGVSDPGTELVRACVAADIGVDPIPGPTAPIAAAAASGFPLNPFTILGFAPHRLKDKILWVDWLLTINHAFSFFDSPHRVAATLRLASTKFGSRPVVVAREVSKLHQEFLRGTAESLSNRITNPMGEFTIVVGPSEPPLAARSTPGDVDIEKQLVREFCQITETGSSSRRAAVVALAKKYGLTSRDAYSAIERNKQPTVV